MRRLAHCFSRLLLSGSEQSAVQQLVAEFRISRLHRAGLRYIDRMRLSRPERLNLGSGAHRKSGFLNVDLFPGGDLTLDLRRGLPFESGCCELIVSEHCFEHVDYPEPISHLVRDCFRVLKRGGILRFSVPDTEWALNDYASGRGDAGYFLACAEHQWHPKGCTTRLEHINYHFRQRGEHRFAYDEETAAKMLTEAGFSEPTRVAFDARFDSEHRRIGSLFMSAKRSLD